MGYKACFFKGCRLWESFRKWAPSASSAENVNSGARRLYPVLVPGSPNWRWRIDVDCFVHKHASVDASLDVFDSTLLALVQKNKTLVGLSQTLGLLAYVRDLDRKGSVGSSYSAGAAAVNIGAPGGGWTPTSGRYVLFRDTDSQAGFVVSITGWSAPNLTVTLPEAIDSDWEVYDCPVYFPDCRPIGMSHGDIDTNSLGDFRPSVVYSFVGAADPVFSSDYDQDI